MRLQVNSITSSLHSWLTDRNYYYNIVSQYINTFICCQNIIIPRTKTCMWYLSVLNELSMKYSVIIVQFLVLWYQSVIIIFRMTCIITVIVQEGPYWRYVTVTNFIFLKHLVCSHILVQLVFYNKIPRGLLAGSICSLV